MASIQDHPKKRIIKIWNPKTLPCPPPDSISPAVSVVSFFLQDLWQDSQPLGAAVVGRHRITAAGTLGGRPVGLMCAMSHFYIKSYIAHPALPCSPTLQAALWGQPPSRAGLLVLPSKSDHRKRHGLRIQGFDVHLFPFILIFTTFPLKSASHRLSYKLSSSVAYEAPNCRQCGYDLNFQSKRQIGSHHISTPAGVVKFSSPVFFPPFNLYHLRVLIRTWRK